MKKRSRVVGEEDRVYTILYKQLDAVKITHSQKKERNFTFHKNFYVSHVSQR